MAESRPPWSVNATQDEPDLVAALRLAWHRDDLTDRNTNIPPFLPAVWATLGQPIRAEALARSITDPDRQASALTGVAQALAEAGHHDHAEQRGPLHHQPGPAGAVPRPAWPRWQRHRAPRVWWRLDSPQMLWSG